MLLLLFSLTFVYMFVDNILINGNKLFDIIFIKFNSFILL